MAMGGTWTPAIMARLEADRVLIVVVVAVLVVGMTRISL